MKYRAGGGRGLQPTLSAHPQPCASPPAATAAAAWTGEPLRPAQSSQILPTPPLLEEPRPELLIGPRIVTPADRTPTVHDPTVLHSSRYAGRMFDYCLGAPLSTQRCNRLAKCPRGRPQPIPRPTGHRKMTAQHRRSRVHKPTGQRRPGWVRCAEPRAAIASSHTGRVRKPTPHRSPVPGDSRYRVTPINHVRNRRRRCTQLCISLSERGQADQINTSGQHIQANVLPRARQAPGIVSGFWMTDMAGATLNVMVFESEDAARSALEPVRTAPRPPWMQVESADVCEVLAHF